MVENITVRFVRLSLVIRRELKPRFVDIFTELRHDKSTIHTRYWSYMATSFAT